jgi:uncharacterized protein (TIGR03083 family)
MEGVSNARAECRRLLRAERRDLGALLAVLTPDQRACGSLCDGWTVEQVAAHLLAWDDLTLYRTRREHLRALRGFTILFVRSFGSVRRLNGLLAQQSRGLEWATITQRFGAEDDRALKWLFDGSSAEAHLAEYVIHHQDIRRSLSLARTVPAERLVAALEGITKLPGVRWTAWQKLRRHRWQATDVPWSRGRGPTISAPAERILMALAGRPVALDQPLTPAP